jgi:hypothetical protein
MRPKVPMVVMRRAAENPTAKSRRAAERLRGWEIAGLLSTKDADAESKNREYGGEEKDEGAGTVVVGPVLDTCWQRKQEDASDASPRWNRIIFPNKFPIIFICY